MIYYSDITFNSNWYDFHVKHVVIQFKSYNETYLFKSTLYVPNTILNKDNILWFFSW